MAAAAHLEQDAEELSLAQRWERWWKLDEDLAEGGEGPTRRIAEAREVLALLEATLDEVGERDGIQVHWLLMRQVVRMSLLDVELARAIEASDARGRLRRALRDASLAPFGGWLEGQAVNVLVADGRHAEATAWIEEALPLYADAPEAHAHILTLGADVWRTRGDHATALRLLKEADRELAGLATQEPRSAAWTARCRSLGVRVQVETQLGRLERALEISAEERALAGLAWTDHGGGQEPVPEEVDEARYRYLDILTGVGNYPAVLSTVDRFLGRGLPNEEHRRELEFFRAKALTGLELREPGRVPQARAILEGLLVDEGAWEDRANLMIWLARLDRVEGDLEAMAARVAELEQVLEGVPAGSGSGAVARLSAAARALKAAHARLAGAEPSALEWHLADLEASLDDVLLAWSAAPRLTGGVGFLHDIRKRDLLGELVEQALALGDPDRALEQLLRVQAQGGLARSLGVPVPSLEQLRSRLVEGGGVLLYLPTLEVTHLLVVDREGIEHHRLARARDLRESVRTARVELLGGRAAGPAMATLTNELLPLPVQQRMSSWSHAYLSGTEYLEEPPFALLPFDGSTLGRALGLASAPSLPLAVHLTSPAAEVPPPVTDGVFELFLGPPVAAGASDQYRDLPSLEFGESAWDELVAGLPSGSAVRTVGAEASKQALVAKDLGSARVLHLFCHGVHDVERDLPAGLALAGTGADDGLMWWSDIEALEVPELVVLAACGGARGPGRQGEDGAQHLGGAFLRAGAKAVLLSRGDLEASTTLEMMATFQAHLVRGRSPMEALRLARDEQARTRGARVESGELFLLGVAHRPLFSPAPDQGKGPAWPWLLGAGAVAGAVLAARRPRTTS